MKIEIINGCTSDAILIDEKPLNQTNQDMLVDYLLEKVRSGVLQGTISVQSLIEIFQYDDWEHLAHCDQCNDDVYKTTYEI